MGIRMGLLFFAMSCSFKGLDGIDTSSTGATHPAYATREGTQELLTPNCRGSGRFACSSARCATCSPRGLPSAWLCVARRYGGQLEPSTRVFTEPHSSISKASARDDVLHRIVRSPERNAAGGSDTATA